MNWTLQVNINCEAPKCEEDRVILKQKAACYNSKKSISKNFFHETAVSASDTYLYSAVMWGYTSLNKLALRGGTDTVIWNRKVTQPQTECEVWVPVQREAVVPCEPQAWKMWSAVHMHREGAKIAHTHWMWEIVSVCTFNEQLLAVAAQQSTRQERSKVHKDLP